jgi:hypothetical protein
MKETVHMRLDLGRLRGNGKPKFTHLLLQCFEVDSCEVAFEPWGAVEILRGDDAFDVEISGPGDGVVEIAYRPGGISVWAWSGAEAVARNKAGARLNI